VNTTEWKWSFLEQGTVFLKVETSVIYLAGSVKWKNWSGAGVDLNL